MNVVLDTDLKALQQPGTSRSQYNRARNVMGASAHQYTGAEMAALAKLLEMADLWTAFVGKHTELATEFKEQYAVMKVTKELRKRK